jgi:hypothetical protein
MEFDKLRECVVEKGLEKWDSEIKKDSDTGKLDFLVKEAQEAKLHGKLKDL